MLQVRRTSRRGGDRYAAARPRVAGEVGAGQVRRERLTECQRAGEEGRLAGAMAAFVKWVAGQYEELQQSLRHRVLQIRGQGGGGWGHARTPAAWAELQGGWEIFLQFAMEVGAPSRAEKEQLQRRGEGALGDLAQRQAQYQAGSDPAWRFVALVQAALAGGQAHVADRQGKVPTAAAAWGWQRRGPGRGWEARGTRIGWVAGGDLYLEPTASYEVARTVAGTARLSVSEQTLRQRQVRRTLGGRPRQVLHLRTSDVLLPTE